jgi:hypothetical protein
MDPDPDPDLDLEREIEEKVLRKEKWSNGGM